MFHSFICFKNMTAILGTQQLIIMLQTKEYKNYLMNINDIIKSLYIYLLILYMEKFSLKNQVRRQNKKRKNTLYSYIIFVYN